MKVRTLMYHDVEGPEGVRGGFPGDGPAVYAVTAERFREQLDAVAAVVSESSVTGDDLVAKGARSGAWMVTFDDGGTSGAAAGAELARRGWRAHFFIVSDLVGTPGFMGWDEIRALADQGHVIGSHSKTHPQLISACSPQELRGEWSDSVAALSDGLGTRVTTASVPGGYYSREVGRAAAAAGISCLFTSEPVTGVRRDGDQLLVGRYAIRRGTTAAQAAAAVSGDPRPWLRQRAAWDARAVAKKVGGRHYRRLRDAVLARR